MTLGLSSKASWLLAGCPFYRTGPVLAVLILASTAMLASISGCTWSIESTGWIETRFLETEPPASLLPHPATYWYPFDPANPPNPPVQP